MRSLDLPRTGFLGMLPTTDFIGHIQDITDYLSHLPGTQVNRANSQNISVVKNGSFMRNKGPVFWCPNIFWTAKIPC